MQKCAFVSRNYVCPTDLAMSKAFFKFEQRFRGAQRMSVLTQLTSFKNTKIMRPGNAFVCLCSYDNSVKNTATISGTITA
jgi:hypothetical protein